MRPTKIKVINIDFSVTYISSDMENGARRFGWTDLNRQKIFISDDLIPHKEADTLVHELLHALCWVFDIEDGMKEEGVCSRLSSGLLAVWRDNPEFFVYLQELIREKQ